MSGLGRRAPSRVLSYVVCVLLVGLISIAGHGVRYAVEDLQLISWQSMSTWSPMWSAPIEGATICAWFAERGYPQLVPDLTGDGRVDEADTIEVADILGRVFMLTAENDGTTDSALVWGLSGYLAELAFDEFQIRVYDAGFSDEWATESPGWYPIDRMPGVEIVLLDDPTIDDYTRELLSGAGVIVGIEGYDPEPLFNHYLAGRSIADADDDIILTDFAWSEEDEATTGTQGSILDTRSVMEGGWWLMVDEVWRPVEFMAAISPMEEDTATPFTPSSQPTPKQPGPDVDCCPDLAATMSGWCECGDGLAPADMGGGYGCAVHWTMEIENLRPGCPVEPVEWCEDNDGNRFLIATTAFATGRNVDGDPDIIDQPQYLVGGAELAELNATGRTSIGDTFAIPWDPAKPNPDWIYGGNINGWMNECIDECDDVTQDSNYTGELLLSCPRDGACCPNIAMTGVAWCSCGEPETLPDGSLHWPCTLEWYVDLEMVVAACAVPTTEVPIECMLSYEKDPATGEPIPFDTVFAKADGVQLGELNATGRTSVKFEYPLDWGGQSQLGWEIYVSIREPAEVYGCSDIATSDNRMLLLSDCARDDVALPDLVVSEVHDCSCYLSSDNDPYCTFTVDAYIGNLNASVAIAKPFRVRMDPSPWGSMQEKIVDGAALAELNATGNTIVSFSFGPGPRIDQTPCGEVWITADIDLEVAETDETNNVAVLTDCCDVLPELTLEPAATCACTPSEDYNLYCETSLDVWVKNEIPQWPVRSSFDVTMDPGHFGGVQTQTIDAGLLSTLNRDGAVLITFKFSPGRRGAPSPACATITLEVDPDDRVREATDRLGQAENVFRVDACCLPDLEFVGTATCAFEEPSDGNVVQGTLTVDGTLYNRNPSAAVGDRFDINILLTGETTGTSGDEHAGVLTLRASQVATLNASGSVPVHYEAPFARAHPVDECRKVEIDVDHGNVVPETDETNNQVTLTPCCTGGIGPSTPPADGCPDLTIEFDSTSCACEALGMGTGYRCEVSADVIVRNVGTTDAADFTVWLDGDNGFDSETVWSLAAGAEKRLTLGYEFDVVLGGFDEEIDAKADWYAEIAECDETNNVETETATCD